MAAGGEIDRHGSASEGGKIGIVRPEGGGEGEEIAEAEQIAVEFAGRLGLVERVAEGGDGFPGAAMAGEAEAQHRASRSGFEQAHAEKIAEKAEAGGFGLTCGNSIEDNERANYVGRDVEEAADEILDPNGNSRIQIAVRNV